MLFFPEGALLTDTFPIFPHAALMCLPLHGSHPLRSKLPSSSTSVESWSPPHGLSCLLGKKCFQGLTVTL